MNTVQCDHTWPAYPTGQTGIRCEHDAIVRTQKNYCVKHGLDEVHGERPLVSVFALNAARAAFWRRIDEYAERHEYWDCSREAAHNIAWTVLVND